ncbi:MAG: PASTA domain-containing protein, partial [Candidatus Cloacimonadota bacterium]|nr:PASTA domain-containing protein [Candidatus Cloacimonadota bacterium]
MINMKRGILSTILAFLILMFMFLLGFVGINFIMKKITGQKNIVETPNLVNMHSDIARKECKKIGLYTNIKIEEYNNEIEEKYIISQNPPSGMKVKKNRTIDIIVSKGAELVRVPFLETRTENQAKLRLENVGLKMGKVNFRYSDNLKKGKVIYSEPPA